MKAGYDDGGEPIYVGSHVLCTSGAGLRCPGVITKALNWTDYQHEGGYFEVTPDDPSHCRNNQGVWGKFGINVRLLPDADALMDEGL